MAGEALLTPFSRPERPVRKLLCAVLIVAAGCSDGDGDVAAPSVRGAVTAGSLASATLAVRAACREFYDDNPDDFEELLTPEALAAQCDVPAVEWRSDCYAERPGEFVPGEGGCAYLGGYLAVWHGHQTFAEGRVFGPGHDVWTVIPESD